MTEQVQLYNQAVAALNQRDWGQAQRLAQHLLRSLPQHAGVHFVAGVAALELKQMQPAAAHLYQATTLNPERADYATQLAKVLAMGRFMQEAHRFADQAMALHPTDAHTLDTLGVVYTQVNEHVAALGAFTQAVQLAPQQASFRYNLGTSLLFSGRLQEAEQEYRACLALEPRYWKVYLSLSQLRKWTAEENNLALLQRVLASAGDVPEAVLHLNLALAKEHEDIGDYHAAFRGYVQGKAVQKRARGYTSSRDQQLFDALHRTFHAGDAPAPGFDSEEPIFVVGMPRSGTTLVDRILSSHPQVHSAGELQNFSVVLKRMVRTPSPAILDVDTLTRLQGLDWRELGRAYVESTRPGTAAKPRFVDKLPHNFLYVGHIARALPNARIVCLHRDPMDTCLSNFRQLFALSSPYYDYSFDLMDVGRYYLMFERLMAHWRALFPQRFLEIDYEDLVLEQEATTRRLLEFCGLPWDEACLRFEQNQAPVATASVVQVRTSMTRAYMGRWRRYGEDLAELKQLLDTQSLRVQGRDGR
ncbi:sulfotransferase [Xanthomonas sp. AM6]|uniref:tetratricopeptide repeat-containing sulfotransferase family protein n=1 Tax=Xanthomonas sp. AM6 TaxID=2982531 RepID=UPI0021D9A6FA|nr:tetratricopeptide repeat-containing sulfotransferase family protein [Xanthomonas sp. AM6]UYB50942.1 sulfotransferase [Xanthomonas sp. AM6]